MKIMDKAEGIEFVADCILKNTIVPIIGSGFTAGCEAFAGNVPNGPQLTALMKDVILKHCKTYSDEEIEVLDFKDAADIFLDEEEVPLNVRLEIFRNHFTSVKLQHHKIDFLKCWQYLYTINVDDAIENNCKFEKILPYTSIRSDLNNLFKQRNFLIKLHGDAVYELTSEDKDNIVFSQQQYISSLTNKKNEGTKKFIYSDLKQKNIIYIGCSLVSEIDLAIIYGEVKQDISASYIIQLRTTTPSAAEEKKLSKVGVNTILLIDDYDSFYKEVVNTYLRKKGDFESHEFPFKNPKSDKIKSKKGILKYYLGESLFDYRNNIYRAPAILITRSILKTIISTLDISSYTIIRGRRFSGKSILIYSLIKNIVKYDTYYFPSTHSFDEITIKSLFKNHSDSVFIFDSNSITPDTFHLIWSSKCAITESNNKIFIVSNTSEDFLIEKLDAEYYELPSIFDQLELFDFNDNADKFAFIQRHRNDTNLDYVFKLLKQQEIYSSIFPKNIGSFTENEKTILIMICTFDKIFFHELAALDIPFREAKDFTLHNPVLFEIIDCDPHEADGKSVKKIVHNSNIALLELMRSMTELDIIKSIESIVKNLYIYDQYKYKNIILFDTLNQLFSNDGAGHLIDRLYYNLEKTLYYESHFWLQRAKSIYRLFKKDKERLKEAVSYALKVFNDAKEDYRLKIKAAFSASLIYCLLYTAEDNIDYKIKHQIESIKLAKYSILSLTSKHMPKSFHNEIFRTVRRSRTFEENLTLMCKDFLEHNLSHAPELLNDARDIISRLEILKQNIRKQQSTNNDL